MNKSTKTLCYAAMFVALGFVLPFFTAQVPQIGSMLLPMHIPVLLCGLVCGWQYGMLVGVLLPLLRHVLIGMPPLLSAVPMAFELGTYGFVVGWLYQNSRWQCLRAIYRCLIAAMLAGRLVWGVVQALLIGIGAYGLTFKLFITSVFINAIPGIALQLILIPTIMVALHRTGLVPFMKDGEPVL